MNKISIVLICFLILFCGTFSVQAAPFDDIQGHWAQNVIEKWNKYEIVKGVGNNYFNPNETITRAEIATLISRLIGLEEKADISKFSDVENNDWYRDSFEKCFAAGIFNGDGEKLNPKEPVSREMFFSILARTFEIPEDDVLKTDFSDSNNISEWARGHTFALINSGYVNGINEREIAPMQFINRASVMTLIDKLVSNYVTEDKSVLTGINDGVSVIKANNCIVTDGYSGNLFFTKPNISAKFETNKQLNIVVVSSNVTLIDVPNGSSVVIKSGAKNTMINGITYTDNQKLIIDEAGTLKKTAKIEETEKNHIHTPSEKVKENVVSGTCKDRESYDEVWYCTECKEEISKTKKIGDLGGHAPASAVKENEVAGTCETKGTYDEVVYCSVCDEEVSRKTVYGIYGNHNFIDDVCICCGIQNNSYTETTESCINVENVVASPGEQVEVKVSIKNNPGILGAVLNFKFDEKIGLVGASNGEAFSLLEMTAPGKYVSNCNFVWDGMEEEAIDDGNIIILYFDTPIDIATGEKMEIKCSYKQGDIVNHNFEEVELQVYDGSITIK